MYIHKLCVFHIYASYTRIYGTVHIDTEGGNLFCNKKRRKTLMFSMTYLCIALGLKGIAT